MLLCIGDHIAAGEYVVHSYFSQAINFIRRGEKGGISPLMVSFVTEDIGPGPTNIVVRHLKRFQNSSLRISDHSLITRSRTDSFDNTSWYDSTLDFRSVQRESFTSRLKRFETILLQTAPPKSLAFLLEPKRERQFTSEFEQAYVARIRTGIREIVSGNVGRGIGMIKGLGFGLTPSGDDFIVGFLLGLVIIEGIDGRDLRALRQQIYDMTVSQNPISNTFLYCAKEGWVFERWKHVLTLLLKYDTLSMDGAIRRLLSVGETSGADSAVGFVFSMKYVREM